MNDIDRTVLRDADGNYFAFPSDELAAALVNGDDGQYYDVGPDELAAAQVSEESRDAVDTALALDEVAGFGDPIPGIDVKLGRNPPRTFSMMGSIGFGATGGSGIKAIGSLKAGDTSVGTER